jgi:predicted transcriptional regulator
LVFNEKRSRLQIIADILISCKRPQTQTCIRRRTNISYEVLHNSVLQLFLNGWIMQVTDKHGQVKFVVAQKGTSFLDKWLELQKLMDNKQSSRLLSQTPKLEAVMAQPKLPKQFGTNR